MPLNKPLVLLWVVACLTADIVTAMLFAKYVGWSPL